MYQRNQVVIVSGKPEACQWCLIWQFFNSVIQEISSKPEDTAVAAESNSGSSSSSDSSDSEKDGNEDDDEIDEKDVEKLNSLMTSVSIVYLTISNPKQWWTYLPKTLRFEDFSLKLF